MATWGTTVTRSTAELITASMWNGLNGPSGNLQYLYDNSGAGGMTAVTFSAGNFTGNGSMTWTLTSPDQVYFGYAIRGKLMTLHFQLDTTSVGGTPNSQLQITIPLSKVATRTKTGTCRIIDNGTSSIGFCFVSASGTVVSIALGSAGTWAASTNATYIQGEIEFEIN